MLNREQINLIKEGWATNLLSKYNDKFKEFFLKLKHQFQYNAKARTILSTYITTGNISKNDVSELKTISTDLLKMVGLGSIALLPIPGGVLLMMFLINSAKQVGIDLVPSHFESIDTNYVDLNTYDINALYDIINKECFNGELQKIPILIKPLKGVTAKYSAKINKSKIPYLTFDDKITISNLTHLTEEKLKNILCHEMIHYWVNSRIDVRDHHGLNFIENMNRVNRLGYNVSLKDEELGAVNQEISVSQQLFITGTYINQYKFYVLVPVTTIKKMKQSDIENAIAQYISNSKFTDVICYITTSPDCKLISGSNKIEKYKLLKSAYNYLLTNITNSPKTSVINSDDIISLGINNLNESVNSGINYGIKAYNEDDDRINITLYNKNQNEPYLIGKIIYEYSWGGFDIKDIIDEDKYYKLFPDDKYIKIEHIQIEPYYATKGFGRILMNIAIDKIKETKFNRIYLNASPMGKRIPLVDLIRFYESLGFKVFHKEANNAEMYIEI